MQVGADNSEIKQAYDTSSQPQPHALEEAKESQQNKADLQGPKDDNFKTPGLVCHASYGNG